MSCQYTVTSREVTHLGLVGLNIPRLSGLTESPAHRIMHVDVDEVFVRGKSIITEVLFTFLAMTTGHSGEQRTRILRPGIVAMLTKASVLRSHHGVYSKRRRKDSHCDYLYVQLSLLGCKH